MVSCKIIFKPQKWRSGSKWSISLSGKQQYQWIANKEMSKKIKMKKIYSMEIAWMKYIVIAEIYQQWMHGKNPE